MSSPSRQATAAYRRVLALRNPRKAIILQRFFKTGKGEYGEGDVFLGLTVPTLRKLLPTYTHLSLADLTYLLQRKEHEVRFLALLLLIKRFRHGDVPTQRSIYKIYLGQTIFINNWDLVDLSAEHIVGAWLEARSKTPLQRLARSTSVWERRIAMLATFAYIKQGRSQEALEIATLLVHDGHDLIQKAVGWMLREIGKRCSQNVECAFLHVHASHMPRTMLRYAIEKFSPAERRHWLTRVGE